MRELSVEELLDGYREALANAGELLDEAELLLENEHYARAYFLAHIACEEMAKSPMFYRVACELALDLSTDWRKLDRRLRDHQDKIRNVLTMDYFQSEIRADDSDLRDYEEDLAKVPVHNEAKNDSLYVGLTDKGFARPSTRFDRDGAEALTRLARARLEVFDIRIPHSREELVEFLQSPAGRLARLIYSGDAERLKEKAREASKGEDE